jgi:hypothetical protein
MDAYVHILLQKQQKNILHVSAPVMGMIIGGEGDSMDVFNEVSIHGDTRGRKGRDCRLC